MHDHRMDLIARQRAGETLKFHFFWGHSGTGPGPWALSQWWEAPFVVDGRRYPTAEHWMMAQKALLFGDEPAHRKILEARSPGSAKALGRTVQNFEEERWKEARFEIVRTGNLHKFGQHPELLQWLLNTGNTILVEASPRDRIWGIGLSASDPRANDVAAWPGLNLLGFALGEARDLLRQREGKAG